MMSTGGNSRLWGKIFAPSVRFQSLGVLEGLRRGSSLPTRLLSSQRSSPRDSSERGRKRQEMVQNTAIKAKLQRGDFKEVWICVPIIRLCTASPFLPPFLPPSVTESPFVLWSE